MVKKVMIVFFITMFFCGVNYTRVCAEEHAKGAINWTEGYVAATGYGTATPSGNKAKDRIKAFRTAEVNAQRALLEIINGVRIDSETTVQNMALKEDYIKVRVEGIIKGAEVVKKDIEWIDNSPMATIEMRVCLSGFGRCASSKSLVNSLNLDQAKAPPYVPARNFISNPPPPEVRQPAIAQDPAKKEAPPVFSAPKPPVYDSGKPVTGLVLNLEGRSFEREILPVIVTEGESGSRLTVYSAKSVKPEVFRTFGVVRYADTQDQAVNTPQVGSNAIIITASSVTKENMIVISVEGARILRETLVHGNDYLSDAKVVVSSR